MLETPMTRWNEDIREYAMLSFKPDLSLKEAAIEPHAAHFCWILNSDPALQPFPLHFQR